MELISYDWYTHGIHIIGIVKCKNQIGEIKSYIGVGLGSDERSDIEIIMRTGAKFRG